MSIFFRGASCSNYTRKEVNRQRLLKRIINRIRENQPIRGAANGGRQEQRHAQEKQTDLPHAFRGDAERPPQRPKPQPATQNQKTHSRAQCGQMATAGEATARTTNTEPRQKKEQEPTGPAGRVGAAHRRRRGWAGRWKI